MAPPNNDPQKKAQGKSPQGNQSTTTNNTIATQSNTAAATQQIKATKQNTTAQNKVATSNNNLSQSITKLAKTQIKKPTSKITAPTSTGAGAGGASTQSGQAAQLKAAAQKVQAKATKKIAAKTSTSGLTQEQEKFLSYLPKNMQPYAKGIMIAAGAAGSVAAWKTFKTLFPGLADSVSTAAGVAGGRLVSKAAVATGKFILNPTGGKKSPVVAGFEKARKVASPKTHEVDMIKIADEIRKDFIEKIEKSSEDLKKSYAMDTSYLGIAFKRLEDTTKNIYGRFANMNSEAFKLYGSFDKFQEAATNNIKDLGVFADQYGFAITRSEKSLSLFQRYRLALGLEAKDVLAIAREAASRREIPYKHLERIMIATDKAAKKYGINVKTIRKETNALRSDFENFGHIGEEAMADLVARMRTLGIEAKDLKTVMGFTTFDDAAKSAAALNQAFGMNVDAMKLIKAENPGEIIDMFRESLLNTGKTYDDLTFREKKYLAQHTKMSADMLKSAMQYGDVGQTFRESQEGYFEDADSKSNLMKRQIKAMKELSHSIAETKEVKQPKGPMEAYKDAIKKFAGSNKALRDSLINTSASIERVYTKFTGSGSKKFQKSLHNAAKGVSNLVNTLSKVTVNENLINGLNRLTKAYGKFASVFNKRLTKSQRGNIIKEMYDEILKMVKEDAFLGYYQKYKKFYLDFTTKIVFAIGSTIIPIAEQLTREIYDQLNSLLGNDGLIDFQKLADKFDLPIERIRNQFEKLGNTFSNISGIIGMILGNIVEAAKFIYKFSTTKPVSFTSPASKTPKVIKTSFGTTGINKLIDIESLARLKLDKPKVFSKSITKIVNNEELTKDSRNNLVVLISKINEMSARIKDKAESRSDVVKVKDDSTVAKDGDLIVRLENNIYNEAGELTSTNYIDNNIGKISELLYQYRELLQQSGLDSSQNTAQLTLQQT